MAVKLVKTEKNGMMRSALEYSGGFVGWPTDPGYTQTGCPIFENAMLDLDGNSLRSMHGCSRVILNKLEDTVTKAAHNGMMICFFDAGVVYRSPGIGIAIVDYKNTSPDRRVVALGYNPFLKPTDFATSGGSFWNPTTTPVLIVYSYPRTTGHEYPTILNVGKQTFFYAQNLPTHVLDEKGFRPCALLPPTRKPVLRIAGTDTSGGDLSPVWTAVASQGSVSRVNSFPSWSKDQDFYNQLTLAGNGPYTDWNVAYYNGVSVSVGATVTHIGIYVMYPVLGETLPSGVFSFLMATADTLGGTVHEAVINQELVGGQWTYVQIAKPSTMSGAVTVESVGIRMEREHRTAEGVLARLWIGGRWDLTVAQVGPCSGKWRAVHTIIHREFSEESDPSPVSNEVDCGTASYSLAYCYVGYRGFWDTEGAGMVNDPGACNNEIPQNNYSYPQVVTQACYPDTMYDPFTWYSTMADNGQTAIKIYLHKVGEWVSDDGNDTAMFFCVQNSGSTQGAATLDAWPVNSSPTGADGTNSFTITKAANARAGNVDNNVMVEDVDDLPSTGDALFPYFGPPPSCKVAKSIGGRIFCANPKSHDYTTTATAIKGKDLIKFTGLSSELWPNEANYTQEMEITSTTGGDINKQTKTYEIIKSEYKSTNNVFVRLGRIPLIVNDAWTGDYLDQIIPALVGNNGAHQGIGTSETVRARLKGRKNRVWFSHKTSRFGPQPQYFPVGNYVDIDMDGDEVVGIEQVGDKILFFGKNGVWFSYYDENALDDDPASAFPLTQPKRVDGSPGLLGERSIKKVDADHIIYLGEGNTICEGSSAGTSVNRPLTNRCRDMLAKEGDVDPAFLVHSHATFDRASNLYRLYMIDDDATNSTPAFPSAVLDTATPVEDFTKGIEINLNSNTLATFRGEKNKGTHATADRARFCPTCSLEISSTYADGKLKTKRIYLGDRFGYIYHQDEYAYSFGAPGRSTNFANGQQRLRWQVDYTKNDAGYTNGWNSSTKTLWLTETSGLVTDGDGLKDLVLMVRTFAGTTEGSEYHRIASNTGRTITLRTSLTNSMPTTANTRAMIGVIEPRIQFKHRYFTIAATPKLIRISDYHEEGLSYIYDNSEKYQIILKIYKAAGDNLSDIQEYWFADTATVVGDQELIIYHRRKFGEGWITVGSQSYAPFSSRVLVYDMAWEQEAGRHLIRGVEVMEAFPIGCEMLNA